VARGVGGRTNVRSGQMVDEGDVFEYIAGYCAQLAVEVLACLGVLEFAWGRGVRPGVPPSWREAKRRQQTMSRSASAVWTWWLCMSR
jgi:hypothetical protein